MNRYANNLKDYRQNDIVDTIIVNIGIGLDSVGFL